MFKWKNLCFSGSYSLQKQTNSEFYLSNKTLKYLYWYEYNFPAFPTSKTFSFLLCILLFSFTNSKKVVMEVLLSVEMLGFPTSVAPRLAARLGFTSETCLIWQNDRYGIPQLSYFLTLILRCIEKFIRDLQSVRYFRAILTWIYSSDSYRSS